MLTPKARTASDAITVRIVLDISLSRAGRYWAEVIERSINNFDPPAGVVTQQLTKCGGAERFPQAAFTAFGDVDCPAFLRTANPVQISQAVEYPRAHCTS